MWNYIKNFTYYTRKYCKINFLYQLLLSFFFSLLLFLYMNNMFNGCTSLTSIPDISEWCTINITDMSEIKDDKEKMKQLKEGKGEEDVEESFM